MLKRGNGGAKNKDWVMDFSLTSEQQELVDAASRFAKERLAPSYRAREAALCIER